MTNGNTTTRETRGFGRAMQPGPSREERRAAMTGASITRRAKSMQQYENDWPAALSQGINLLPPKQRLTRTPQRPVKDAPRADDVNKE